MISSLVLAIALIAQAPCAGGSCPQAVQAPVYYHAPAIPVVISPPGVYTITTPGPTQITVGPTSVLVDWSASPGPPQPTPTPVPPQPPAPPVPPTPAKHTGPFYLSLIVPQTLTQEQNDLRVGILALDRSALKIHGARSYYEGAAELKKLGLDAAALKHTLPVLIIQEQPSTAKDGDPWPIVDSVEPAKVEDIKTRLEGLLK